MTCEGGGVGGTLESSFGGYWLFDRGGGGGALEDGAEEVDAKTILLIEATSALIEAIFALIEEISCSILFWGTEKMSINTSSVPRVTRIWVGT